MAVAIILTILVVALIIYTTKRKPTKDPPAPPQDTRTREHQLAALIGLEDDYLHFRNKYTKASEESILEMTTRGICFVESIAGITFRENVGKCYGSHEALLVPEPENEHDHNAIKIVDKATGIHVGYIPRTSTSEVRTLLTKTPTIAILIWHHQFKPYGHIYIKPE